MQQNAFFVFENVQPFEDWPAQSPDFSIFELLWWEMKKQELEKFPVWKPGTCFIQYHIEYGNITGNWYTPQEAYDYVY